MIRAIGLFLRRILRALLVPWYIRWVFALPWWVLAPFTIWLGVMLAQFVPQVWQTHTTTKAAVVAAPMPLRPVGQLDPVQDVSPLGEVHVSATYRPQYAPMRIAVTGLDIVAVPLFAKGRDSVRAIAYAYVGQADDLLAYLQSQGNGGSFPVQINGTLADQDYIAARAKPQLRGYGLTGAHEMVAISPFLGGRMAGLNSSNAGDWILLAFGGALFLVLGVTILRKFRQRADTRRAALRMTAHGMTAHGARDPMRKSPVHRPVAQAPQARQVSPWGSTEQPDISRIDAPAVPPVPPPLPPLAPPPKEPKAQSRPHPEPAERPKRISAGYRARTAEEIVREIFGPKSGR